MSELANLKWHREGLALSVPRDHTWWKSHAQVPTVLPLSDSLWRIFVSARDANNQSYIVAVDLDPGNRMRVVAEHFSPFLPLGGIGHFDTAGMGASSILRAGDRIRMYYSGAALRQDVPAQTAISLAVSSDGLAFERAVPGPVLTTGPHDPLFVLTSHVLRRESGFQAWYVSGTEWRIIEGRPEMFYEIRTARSLDGVFWDRNTTRVVGLREGIDAGAGRPFVMETRHGLHLWFCRRGADFRRPGDGAYHLASVALDHDGIATGEAQRLAFSNPPGSNDFDSWAQSYACVLPHGDDLIMFYNGNDFGSAGFGWARCPGAATLCS